MGFPRPLGVGIDLVEVERLAVALRRTKRFASRVFTATERSTAENSSDPAQRYAARWAAKEAALKAMGVGILSVSPREVEVVNAEDGRPAIVLHGRAAQIAESLGIGSWMVSLTHTSQLAGAVVLALGEPVGAHGEVSGE